MKNEPAIKTTAQDAYYLAHPACQRCRGSGWKGGEEVLHRVGDDAFNGEFVDGQPCPDCRGTGLKDGLPRWSPSRTGCGNPLCASCGDARDTSVAVQS